MESRSWSVFQADGTKSLGKRWCASVCVCLCVCCTECISQFGHSRDLIVESSRRQIWRAVAYIVLEGSKVTWKK